MLYCFLNHILSNHSNIYIYIFIYPLKITIQVDKAHYFTKLPPYNTTRTIPRGEETMTTPGLLFDMIKKQEPTTVNLKLHATKNICNRNNLKD